MSATTEEYPCPRAPLSDDRAWGIEDAAYFLNYSESMVRKLEREGRLPSLPRQCNRITFDPRVVRAFRDGTLNMIEIQRSRARR